jgi:hypothetical protein
LSETEGYGRRQSIVGKSANHFELAFTAAEFLVDFGQAYEGFGEPTIHTRIIMTPASARALSEMMQSIIRQFENLTGRDSGDTD